MTLTLTSTLHPYKTIIQTWRVLYVWMMWILDRAQLFYLPARMLRGMRTAFANGCAKLRAAHYVLVSYLSVMVRINCTCTLTITDLNGGTGMAIHIHSRWPTPLRVLQRRRLSRLIVWSGLAVSQAERAFQQHGSCRGHYRNAAFMKILSLVSCIVQDPHPRILIGFSSNAGWALSHDLRVGVDVYAYHNRSPCIAGDQLSDILCTTRLIWILVVLGLNNHEHLQLGGTITKLPDVISCSPLFLSYSHNHSLPLLFINSTILVIFVNVREKVPFLLTLQNNVNTFYWWIPHSSCFFFFLLRRYSRLLHYISIYHSL